MKTGLLMSLLHVCERILALSTLEVKAIVDEVCGQRSQSFCRQRYVTILLHFDYRRLMLDCTTGGRGGFHQSALSDTIDTLIEDRN